MQILTLHVSKGLEFPLVFLPFVAIGRQRKAPTMALYQLDGERVRQVPTRFRHGDEPRGTRPAAATMRKSAAKTCACSTSA